MGITSFPISVLPNHPNKSWELSSNTTSPSKSTSSKYILHTVLYLSLYGDREYTYIYISVIIVLMDTLFLIDDYPIIHSFIHSFIPLRLKPIDLIKSTTQLLCLVTIRSWKHPEMTSTTIYSTRET